MCSSCRCTWCDSRWHIWLRSRVRLTGDRAPSLQSSRVSTSTASSHTRLRNLSRWSGQSFLMHWNAALLLPERESHLLNPPPGSTDPERFATVSIGIGDRVLFHPAPREPRHEWCEVSLRTEAGQFASSDLPWPVRSTSMGYPSAPSKPRHFITTRQFQDPSVRPACNGDTATGPRGTL